MSEPKGTIYDLGYKRYVGTRRPQATRWRVITRQILSFAWKKWWRYKLWLGLTLLICAGVCTVMVVTSTGDMGTLRRVSDGRAFREVDQMVFMSVNWFGAIAFLLTLTVGVSVVAHDLRTGAFTFYFSRPVRPIDYLIGKWFGLVTLFSTVLLAPMMVITLTRLGISENTDQMLDDLGYVPKTFVIGALASMAYASLALGFSAILKNRWINLAIWCAYFFIFRVILLSIAFVAKVPALAAFDVPFALESLVYELFGIVENEPEMVRPSGALCMIGLGFNIALGAGFAFLRVRQVGHAGIGAS